MRRIPTIGAVMTAFPYAVEAGASPSIAREMMTEHDVHHLPVVDAGELVGVIDDWGLRHAERSGEDTVDGVCIRGPLIVDLARRLDGVALEMAERRASAALVTRHGKLVGILTDSDVCRLLGETLRDVFTPPSGNDAA